MNFFTIHLLRCDYVVKPEDEDTRRVHARKHRGIPRISSIEMCQVIQMRLVGSIDAVIADRGA
jgi:hypothetical protein